MTPEELRRQAAELDERGKKMLADGRPNDAAAAFVQAETYEAAAAEMERLGRLPAANRRGKHKRQVVAAERLRVSKGRAGGDPDPLVKAVNDAGFTLRSLVEKLREEGYRVSHPFLRQCRLGTSRIRKPLAERIEALTGFRATKANWPAGWAREPAESR